MAMGGSGYLFVFGDGMEDSSVRVNEVRRSHLSCQSNFYESRSIGFVKPIDVLLFVLSAIEPVASSHICTRVPTNNMKHSTSRVMLEHMLMSRNVQIYLPVNDDVLEPKPIRRHCYLFMSGAVVHHVLVGLLTQTDTWVAMSSAFCVHRVMPKHNFPSG
jgi:hypothetical protein